MYWFWATVAIVVGSILCALGVNFALILVLCVIGVVGALLTYLFKR